MLSVGERFRYPLKNIKSRTSALRDAVVCSYSICSFLMSLLRSSTRACFHFCVHSSDRIKDPLVATSRAFLRNEMRICLPKL
jgi:hypothetical protein